MKLTPRQLQYGFGYYFKDEWKKIDTVKTVDEYRGQKELVIDCTQLDEREDPRFKSATAKKRVLAEWCDFLPANPKAFTNLTFGTRMPQELFDAVCTQVNLVRLNIKWGVYSDLSNIENLQKLQLLAIGSGAAVKSIEPLTKLTKLVALGVENFQKITDYSPLTKLKTLASLSIEGDGLSPQYIHIDSLDFLARMPQLRYLSLLTYRLQKKDYRPILKCRNLQHLTLPYDREVKAMYEELVSLPKLKWGLLKEKPKLFKK